MGDQKPRERQIGLVDTGERQVQEVGRGEKEEEEGRGRNKRDSRQGREETGRLTSTW